MPKRIEVVLVQHPSRLDESRDLVVLGRTTDPDLIEATRIVLEEQAREGLAYLEHAKRLDGAS